MGDIVEDTNVKAECRQQAAGLLQTMKTLETEFMIILWDQILQRFLKTCVSLQSVDQDLNSACGLYKSLHGYVQALRPTFVNIEDKAKVLTDCYQYHKEVSRQRKRYRKLNNFHGSTSVDCSIESMQPFVCVCMYVRMCVCVCEYVCVYVCVCVCFNKLHREIRVSVDSGEEACPAMPVKQFTLIRRRGNIPRG